MAYASHVPMLIALIEMWQVADRTSKELPHQLASQAREMALQAKTELDKTVRETQGWGIGDVVEPQFAGERRQFEVSGYELLQGKRAGVVLRQIVGRGETPKTVHGTSIGASLRVVRSAGQLAASSADVARKRANAPQRQAALAF